MTSESSPGSPTKSVNALFGIFPQALLAIFIVALIPSAGLLFTLQDREQILNQSLTEDFDKTAALVAQQVDGWITTNLMALQQNASIEGVTAMDAAAQSPVLKAALETYEWTYLHFTIDLEGNNVARSDERDLIYYGDRVYFQDIAEAHKPIGQQVLVGRTSGLPALCLSVPIERDETLAGVMAGCSNLIEVSRVVTDARIGNTGFAFLVDGQGRAIAHGRPEGVITEALQDFSDHPALAAGVVQEMISYRDQGREMIALARPVDLGWTLVVQQESEEAFAQINQAKRNAVVLLVITLLLTLLVAFSFARWLVGPIRALTQVADEISHGKMDITIQGVERKDEIGALARSVKRLATSVKVAATALSASRAKK